VHRAENTDDEARLGCILAALAEVGEPIVFPVHPRTRRRIAEMGAPGGRPLPAHVHTIEPLGYLDMVVLERSARLILTDSGGMQKEAYWLGVPCLTLREETEWVETVQVGWNRLMGTDPARIAAAVRSFVPPPERPPLYGDGHAAERVAEVLASMAPIMGRPS